MAVIAHGTSISGNLGKLIAYNGNPLAINYAHWLAFAGAVAAAVKHATGGDVASDVRPAGANR